MGSLQDNRSSIESERPLKIGIIGCGLVGATAAIALSRLQNAVVTAFERSPTPREAGAWISMNVSGLTILDKHLGLTDIQKILYRGDDEAAYISRHWRTGEVISRAHSSPGTEARLVQARTHRVPLLNVLLFPVPKGIVQYGRAVTGTQVLADGVHVDFEGGESQVFDLVVAADGIYSKTRLKYLPKSRPKYKGTVAYRKNLPVETVRHIKGLKNDTSVWRGQGKVLFLSELGLGQFGFVAIVREDEDFARTLQWEKNLGSAGIDRMRETFKGWDPLIQEVLDTMTNIDAYPLDTAPWMAHLTREQHIAFIGDAAHPAATAGAFGAGASMGFGDVWALFRALEHTYHMPAAKMAQQRYEDGDIGGRGHGYEVAEALRVFDETRRHFLMRVERQMGIDAETALYVAGAGDDEEEWLRRVKERPTDNRWMVEQDVEAAFRLVVDGRATG